MPLDQPADLVANRRQRTVLDLDQRAGGHGIDAVAVDHHLGPRIGAGVECLELPVEGSFHVVVGGW